MTERSTRFFEVDAIKAVGALTVVLIHALRSPFEPGASAPELWLGQLTRFAVPGFLAVSGFLYATGKPASWAETRSRLTRIAVPYLVFSLVAQILRHSQGRALWGPGSGSLWLDFAAGASLGPYYYVFIAALLVSATPLFSRLSRRAVTALFALEVGAQAFFELAGGLPFFWHLRNPLLWAAWFHLGWLARLHYPWLLEQADRHRAVLVLGLTALVAAAGGHLASGPDPAGRRIVEWLAIYPILAVLFFASCGAQAPRWLARPVRTLSDASYTIYLVHPLLVVPLRQALRATPFEFSPVVIGGVWGGAIFGALLLILAGQWTLGARSRRWLGA